MSLAIQVDGIGKMYRIGAGSQASTSRGGAVLDTLLSPFAYLRQMMRPPSEAETLWSLRDVSLEVPRGEVLGLIGHNGAGKSTLLKILSRITEPTTGRAAMFGRVGALLEVGTGFHHELTGRENVYLSGTILGMSRHEIDRKFDEIVDFSGVEQFLDTPIKRYSSGMMVRLGFAVAAHLEPEILLIDEVLAVGDSTFQKKCLGKMGEVAQAGRTVVFVSHSMSAVASLCNRTVVLDKGQVVFDGATTEGIRHYLAHNGSAEMQHAQADFRNFEHEGKDEIDVQCVTVREPHGQPRQNFSNLEPIEIEIDCIIKHPDPGMNIGFAVKNDAEEILFESYHNDVRDQLPASGGHVKISTVLPANLFNNGRYHVDLFAAIYNKRWIIRDLRSISFEVTFNIPNPDFVITNRPGYVAPVLESRVKVI